MIGHQLHKLKYWLVSISGNWFYPVKKLPPGTHLQFFLKYRILLDFEVIFDVGANIGNFSKELFYIYPKSKFYCFEPFPSTFEKLTCNLRRRNYNLYQLALGDKSQLVTVPQNNSNQPDTNTLVGAIKTTDSAKHDSITISTVDEFCRNHSIKTISLLKIDTEGFDLKVLQGASNMLCKGNIKVVYVECGLDPGNRYHIYFPEILSYLTSRDYIFISFFQTDIRKLNQKIHFSNALFVHQSISNQVKTFL